MELDKKVLDKLDKILKPNQKLRIDYGANNFNNKIIHIRAVVYEYQVVYKTWFEHKRRWSYQIEGVYYFHLLLKGGNLKKG